MSEKIIKKENVRRKCHNSNKKMSEENVTNKKKMSEENVIIVKRKCQKKMSK